MERPVEVALFERGELQNLRILSPSLERRIAISAALVTAAVVLLGMLAVAALTTALGFVVHAPTFVASWLGVAAAVAMIAARRARSRARCYWLGPNLDADAFGATEVDLVRRVGRGGDYDLGLVPGMAGTVEHGRSPMPIEALTRAGAVRVPLPTEATVRVELGSSTFVIRRRTEMPEKSLPWAERLRGNVIGAKRLVPLAGVGLPIAVLATLMGSVPTAMAVTEADMRSMIPENATPWQAELYVRAQAQRQAKALHQCFDPLPLSCQKPGFVGVGLALSEDGEVRSHWVARSSYGAECPVSQCVATVAAGMFFEPMPESMRVFLPIQVLRTAKPLYSPQPVFANPAAMTGDGGLVGWEVASP